MRSVGWLIPLVLPFTGFTDAKACSPDSCGNAISVAYGLPSGAIAQHQADCSSFFSITVIPPTSTIFASLVDVASTVNTTVTTLTSTEIDSITASTTITDTATVSSVTTTTVTDTTTTDTTSTSTSTSTLWSTYKSTSTTKTTSIALSTTTSTSTTILVVHSTDTLISTSTSTTTSTSTPDVHPVTKRHFAASNGTGWVTVSPTSLPQYASAVCKNAGKYSSACAAWGVTKATTTAPTPVTTVTLESTSTPTVLLSLQTTVTIDVSVTDTATVEATSVTWSTDVLTSSATETDTITASTIDVERSFTRSTIITTETDISSIESATTTTTTTTVSSISTTTDIIAAVETSVVPWCIDQSVVRGTGCQQREFTISCYISISPHSDINQIVYQAHALSFEDCMATCDSNGFCSVGTYDEDTGLCVNILYSTETNYNPMPGRLVKSFTSIYGTVTNGNCPSYECLNGAGSAPQCCGGSGCPDMVPPYDG